VRRRLLASQTTHTGRAVMCDVPVAAADWSGFLEARYEFNFVPVADRLRGYAWAFPCLIAGEPHINVGVYSVDPEGSYLYELLEREAARVGSRIGRVRAFPIHWYDRSAPIAAPGVLLAGDAAGVDPLMGEGISFAFEYARRAAAAIDRAFGAQDFGFVGYAPSVHASWMGRKLRRLGLAARLFYGPTWPLWFGIAGRSRRAQHIGIRWYNGVDGWDQKGMWAALRGAWSVPPTGP